MDVPSRKLAEATMATIQKYGLGGLWRGCLVNNLKVSEFLWRDFKHYTSFSVNISLSEIRPLIIKGLGNGAFNI